MTTRYVGSGGNDLNNGTSWATRKLTLNGVEDTPVVAGDTVYVGAGVYRELLTCDVSGTAGSPISYIGDYTGANTDGVGGVVRITGSDDDMTATRANCIVGNTKHYRTFTGLQMDTTTGFVVSNSAGTNWITTGCSISNGTVGVVFINGGAVDQAALVDNCKFSQLTGGGVSIGTSNMAATTNTIRNCLFVGIAGADVPSVSVLRTGGVLIANCQFWGAARGIQVSSLPGGYTACTVNNSIFAGCNKAVWAGVLGELLEDYNNFYANTTARTTVGIGANSVAYPPLLDSRWFFEAVNGGRFVTPFDLGAWSQLINLAGTSPPATDMRGTAVIGAQREWGPLEYDDTLLIESAAGGGGPVRILPLMGSIG